MRCFCTKIRTHHCKVVLLDEQELIQEIQDTSRGQEVLDTVYRHLNLLETSYFGLRYIDTSNQTHWLDTTKKVVKQLKGKETFTLYFGVKFYAADPCKLLEEITRYQFFLQVKQDILQGRLPVPFDLAAELGAYVVQSELGDYDPRRHSPGYVSEFRFLSNQSVELESKIAEQHKDMQGQLPSVAELNYLDKVKWLEMYGVDLHPVLGEDNVEYFLGLTPTGVIVLRNKNKVANYFWPRITKIYFKGRYFMLRVCDKNNEENTYGFETPSKPACKHLYKCCVEHHAFFRLVQVSPNPPDVIGTRFSSGRAEKISQREAQMRLRSPPQFTRTPSRRYQRRIVEGAQDIPKVDEIPKANKENIPVHEVKHISVPQPVQSVSSLYRGTSVLVPRCDSPRSTRSAPWTTGVGAPPSRGLYSGSSPRSVRSSGHARPLTARRSSSVESHSSNDSRSCRRHRHRSRRGSDNESELSRCSGKSRRHRHRSRRSSGSEHESRRHSSSKHRYELVESESQWKEVQRKQAEGSSGVHHATVISSSGGGGGGGGGGGRGEGRPRSGYMNSGMETESEHSYHHRRKHRKHRSRSRSPSDKPRLPEELKQHLEFQLVETEGMSESQLREIPYKVVETSAAKAAVKVRLSPTSKRRTHSARRVKSSTLKEEELPSTGDSPPPPYSESPATNQNTPSDNVTATDLANKNTNNNNNNQLPRNGTPALVQSTESANTRSLCSALYGNPATLLGSTHHNINRRNATALDNSNWMSQQDQLAQSKVAAYHHNSSTQHGNSVAGSGLWKQDLPPRSIPFGSMRQSLSNSSNHKAWVGPEVRGTVGLAWQPHVKSPDSHYSHNFGALPETPLSRRPSQDGLLNYPAKYTHEQNPRPNMNASQEYLASSNGGLNYAGISSNLRSSRSSIIDQANGNITYNSPLHHQARPGLPTFTQSSSFVDLNRTSTLGQVNGTEGSTTKPRVTSSSSSSLQSNSNTNTSKSRSNLSVDQNGVSAPNKGIDALTKVTSQSQQQLIAASTDDLNNGGTKWTAAEMGQQQDQANKNWAPLYYQKTTANANADLQNATSSPGLAKSEVNNNPMIVVHEMSTEL